MQDFRAELGSRALFPKLEAEVYAAHAAISPHSLAVRQAIIEVTDSYAERGVSAVAPWFQAREGLRVKLSQLLGADPKELAFIRNTSEGVATIASAYPWEKGDGVVLYEGEFPTNVTPWLVAAKAHDLRPRFLPSNDFACDSALGLERLEAELKKGIKLVAVSSVAFQTGLSMPIKAMAELSHRYGAHIFVDAIQSLGVVPIDVTNAGIDFLAAGGHKWLMGPEGTGVLYAKAERAEELRPFNVGWLSHENALDFLFGGEGLLRYDKALRKEIGFVEAGVANALGFAALDASLGLLLQLGIDTIWRHCNAWNDALECELLERGFKSLRSKRPEQRSGILSVIAPDASHTVALHDALNAAKVTCNVPDGKLRFAPHWPNTLEEVPRVLAHIDRIMQAA